MDYYLFQQINGLAGHWAWLDTLGIFLACYFQYFVGSVLLLFLLAKENKVRVKNAWMIGLALVAALVARLGAVASLHSLITRPRPFVVYQVAQLIPYDSLAMSWPSGHASFFFALSTVVFLFNKKIGWWFLGASTLISLARVFVGVHYPGDILAGAVIGILVGWAVFKIFQRASIGKKIGI